MAEVIEETLIVILANITTKEAVVTTIIITTIITIIKVIITILAQAFNKPKEVKFKKLFNLGYDVASYYALYFHFLNGA
ncbi:hypothetical protein QCA50_009991 [Cerrena zonata]|uniref:Uncharacterized protein n=1 Tax=Cerrena zonata TaxID=2478898 RepID=A0AAW0G631_9APHY